MLFHFRVRKKLPGHQQIAYNKKIVRVFNLSTYAPFTMQKACYLSCLLLEIFSLPFPFCHVVYQDKVRNEVINAKAVATVPFRSLISFHHHSGSYVYSNNQDCFLLILKSTESSSFGSGPIKTINEIHYRCSAEQTSLSATQFTNTTQDCLHSLHRLMSQASSYSGRKEKEKLVQ